MTERLIVYGGSFNPPAQHCEIVRRIAADGRFARIFPRACGPRKDKTETDGIAAVHRAVLCDLGFRGIPGVEVDNADLEAKEFAPLWQVDALYKARFPDAEIWNAVGFDLVQGGRVGRAQIQSWARGEYVWHNCRFAVICRPGTIFMEEDLPPHHLVLPYDVPGASSDIRDLVAAGKPYEHLVPSEVAAHIKRYNLYKGAAPTETWLTLDPPRPLFYVDRENPRAAACAERLGHLQARHGHNCAWVFGGDGTMLDAIADLWRLRLPFVGLNFGRRGYLLNDYPEKTPPEQHFRQMRVHQFLQFQVTLVGIDGEVSEHTAANDAWVAVSNGQMGVMEVEAAGRRCVIEGDGVLVATPPGSTGYARPMGATPMLLDANGYIMVGNHVASPFGWVSTPLSRDDRFAVRGLDNAKRPLYAFVDGRPKGPVAEMRVHMSKTASFELAFHPRRSLNEKLTDALFPRA